LALDVIAEVDQNVDEDGADFHFEVLGGSQHQPTDVVRTSPNEVEHASWHLILP
jgi:hypothetical protein